MGWRGKKILYAILRASEVVVVTDVPVKAGEVGISIRMLKGGYLCRVGGGEGGGLP